METYLTEQEMQQIREEAEKRYPVCMMGRPDERKLNGITHYDFNEDQRNAYAAALTSERERVKSVIEALEFIEMNYGDHDAVRDKIRQTLNAYNQNKEV